SGDPNASLKGSAKVAFNTAVGAFAAKSVSDPVAASAAFPAASNLAGLATTAVENKMTNDPAQKKPYDLMKRAVGAAFATVGNIGQSYAAHPFHPNPATATPGQTSVASAFFNSLGVPIWTAVDALTKVNEIPVEQLGLFDQSVIVEQLRRLNPHLGQQLGLLGEPV
ncbi:hypothetical protein HK405_002040, partial [Cladochytrium tenue]